MKEYHDLKGISLVKGKRIEGEFVEGKSHTFAEIVLGLVDLKSNAMYGIKEVTTTIDNEIIVDVVGCHSLLQEGVSIAKNWLQLGCDDITVSDTINAEVNVLYVAEQLQQGTLKVHNDFEDGVMEMVEQLGKEDKEISILIPTL